MRGLHCERVRHALMQDLSAIASVCTGGSYRTPSGIGQRILNEPIIAEALKDPIRPQMSGSRM